VLVVACAVGIGYPLWWMHRSDSGGQALLNEAHDRLNQVHHREGLGNRSGSGSNGSSVKASCNLTQTHLSHPEPKLPAILAIPAIGLEAPVLQGLGDPVLNEAVGHDSASVWPGGNGISILEAHDASYFSSLGAVHAGDRIFWIDGCRNLVFRVDRVEVTQPGASLPPPPNGIGVALITCWPTDALFWTPDRLVVLASFVRTQATQPRTTPRSPPLDIALPVPSALVSEGLGPSQNGILYRHLRLAGNPARSWAESADPLRTARLAFDELGAARLTIQAGNKSWWSAIALPGVSMPYSISVAGDFDATIAVNGTSVRAVMLVSPTATVGFVVRSGKLYISSVG
jgi:LPXTG-site transpeptidase (sortase) family protein